jgi:hypothetical protein
LITIAITAVVASTVSTMVSNMAVSWVGCRVDLPVLPMGGRRMAWLRPPLRPGITRAGKVRGCVRVDAAGPVQDSNPFCLGHQQGAGALTTDDEHDHLTRR